MRSAEVDSPKCLELVRPATGFRLQLPRCSRGDEGRRFEVTATNLTRLTPAVLESPPADHSKRAMPGDHALGLYQDQRAGPGGPETAENDPKQPVQITDWGSRLFEDHSKGLFSLTFHFIDAMGRHLDSEVFAQTRRASPQQILCCHGLLHLTLWQYQTAVWTPLGSPHGHAGYMRGGDTESH
jgi:hypothetical protein